MLAIFALKAIRNSRLHKANLKKRSQGDFVREWGIDAPGAVWCPGASSSWQAYLLWRVSVALFVTPLKEAFIVITVLLLTRIVVRVNCAALAPAGTLTLTGTPAFVGLLLVSVTTTPPTGASPVRVTVPTEFPPPMTVAGFTVSDESAGG